MNGLDIGNAIYASMLRLIVLAFIAGGAVILIGLYLWHHLQISVHWK